MAEREKMEAKAVKQLERVQLQMTEWVRSLNVNSSPLSQGVDRDLPRMQATAGLPAPVLLCPGACR